MEKKSANRTVEIFLDVKAASRQIILTLQGQACTACKITILDIRDPKNARRAAALGIRHFPTIVMNGKPVARCTRQCPAGNALRRSETGVEAEVQNALNTANRKP